MDDWSVRQYAETKQELPVQLEYFVNDVQMIITNLIHETLQVNPRARPTARELEAVFARLLIPAQCSSSERESYLFSKIFEPLSKEIQADLVSTAYIPMLDRF